MDLSMPYMGLSLENPIIASASPLTGSVECLRALEDAGAAAVVLHSLFAEQIELAANNGGDSDTLNLLYFPRSDHDDASPKRYFELVRAAKRRLTIPVIASLNGSSPGRWTQCASVIEEAGADALELNIYHVPTDYRLTGADVERMYLDLVAEVRAQTRLPLSVKIGPYFSAMANMATRLADAGASGLTLFNRFYQPDIDIETRSIRVRDLTLSDSQDLKLPLRWIGLLYGDVNVDFALTGGVHTHTDALKAVAAGASAVMLASELLKNGVKRIPEILFDMADWLREHEYTALEQLQGALSQRGVRDTSASERGGYAWTLQSAKVGEVASSTASPASISHSKGATAWSPTI